MKTPGSWRDRPAKWAIAFGCLLLFAIGAPAPRPALALSCEQGPYILFFREGQAFVTVEAREVLDFVVRTTGDCGAHRAVVSGHADTSEDPILGLRRARTVAAYLAAHGIPEDDISIENLGATTLRIPTADGVPEIQNRRVEIMRTSQEFAPETE